MRPTAIIELGDGPGWAATDPLDKYCFVTNTREDTVSVVSYSAHREVKRLPVGDGPKRLELRGDVDAVTRMRFSAGGRNLGTAAAPPYRRTIPAPTACSLRGGRVEARIQTTGAALVRTVRVPTC